LAQDFLVRLLPSCRHTPTPSQLAPLLAMPLAMQLVLLDDLKGIRSTATGLRKVSNPPGSADEAASELDAPAQRNLAVVAAAGTVVPAAAGHGWEGPQAAAGRALRSAMRTRVGALLRRSLF